MGRLRALVCQAALALLAASLLVGCGSSSPSTTTTIPVSPAAVPVQGAPASHAGAAAQVAGAPIAAAGYRHWVAVERALGAGGSPDHQALGFLITSEWIVHEAAARHITVSDAEVRRRFEELVHRSFPKPGELQKYLARAHETEADLLVRIRIELLTQRILAQVAAGKSGSERAAALRRFQAAFKQRWKQLTSCSPGYVMEDCREYKGGPEKLAARPHAPAASAASSPAPSSTNSASNSTGEVYSQPGGFSISSPAFERNGAIPAEYTCAGAGVSPALSWRNVPAGAVELFLFVIDLNSNGSNGGQRWVVGGIDPSSPGLAAGKLPAGAIVGTNTAGQAAYGPICPEHGKSDTIEFVLYALGKHLRISPGFQPSVAEAQYGRGKYILGQAAITYGIASRP